ncbi:MAG: GGDEF domain-containing protein [Gammaproteobacteria bacterium]|nr:GGDEF domain-containing protein [Gammaproteobacteria bacterium]
MKKYEKVNEEYSQAVTRLVYTSVIGVVFIVWLNLAPLSIVSRVYDLKIGTWLVGFLIVFTLGILLHAWLFPKPNLIRRVTAIFGDIGLISVGMYAFGEMGGIFYTLYLWVVMGNGLRFGEKHLIFAQTLSILGYIVVVLMSPYWQNQLSLAVGLLTGLIVLPIFFCVLLMRLRYAHESLEQQFHAAEYAANHDVLTNLANRRAFLLHLENLLARVKRKGWYGAIFYIDLDGFKSINDRFGHNYGDKVLVSVASRISAIVREEDVVSRIGGDEFVVAIGEIMPKLELAEKNATVIVEKIIESFVEPIIIMEEVLTVDISIGVALINRDSNDAVMVLDEADMAMYGVKARTGSNYGFILERR